MTRQTTSVRIAAQTDQPNLSKGQKAFNTLVKKIEASRQELGLWQIALEAYQQKVAAECVPLQKSFAALRVEFLHALDRALDRHKLTRAEREFVQGIICQVAHRLLMQEGDEALKALYNKHGDCDFDAEEAAAAQELKSRMKAMFGAGPGSDDFDAAASPQDLLEKIEARMAQNHARNQARRQEAADQPSPETRTPKQQARAEKARRDAETTSLSIREVYRKLASALHPDREPDAGERSRKTALMQRVNQAYAGKDLLQLLELQLELEHIDAKAIAGLSEDRLKHFNKILKDQLAKLEQEMLQYVLPLRAGLHLPQYVVLSPENVVPCLQSGIADLKREVKRMKLEMQVTQQLATFKAWIKASRLQAKAMHREMRNRDDFPDF